MNRTIRISFFKLIQSYAEPLIFFGLAIFALSLIVTIAYMQFFLMENAFFHESAFPLLYSEEIVDSLSVLPENFSGREISPVSWPLVGAILIALGFPVSIFTHSLMAFLFTLFISITTVIYSRLIAKNRIVTVISLISILVITQRFPTTYNWIDQVYIWPMNSYGVYDTISLLFFVLVVSYLFTRKKSEGSSNFDRAAYFFLIAAAFVLGMNGVRGLLLIVVPTLVPLALISFNQFVNQRDSAPDHLLKCIGLLAATAAGLVLAKILVGDFPQPWQARNSFFLVQSAEQLSATFFKSIEIMFRNFGLSDFKNKKDLVSLDTIVDLARLALLGMLVTFPFLPSRLLESPVDRLALWHSRAVIFVILFAAFFAKAASGAPRYFLPICFSLLFLAPIWLKQNARNGNLVLSSVFVGALLVTALTGMYGIWSADRTQYLSGDVRGLTAELEKRGFSRGYSSPWSAHGLTINQFSGGKIRVGNVDVIREPGPGQLPYKPHNHADQDWFMPGWSDGSDQFIAILKPDAPLHERMVGVSRDHWEFKDWTVYVFSGRVPFHSLSMALGKMDHEGLDMARMSATASNKGFDGKDYHRSKFRGLEVIGSHVKGDEDVGSVELTIGPNEAFLYRTGPVAQSQWIRAKQDGQIVGEINNLTSGGWITLSLSLFPQVDLERPVTLIFEDAGRMHGEWSAIALKAD